MSLSNPTNTNINPAVKYLKWSGSEGNVQYWDKEKSENISIELPFKFIKLDTLSTVTGYSDPDSSGYWANEVRSLKVEPLVVKTKNGIKAEGLWSEIGEGLKAQGAKFASSVYIAYLNDAKKLELCNFKFFGSSITEWINFTKEFKIKDGDMIAIDGSNQAKKGSNKYYTPTFSKLEITAKQIEEATELDKQLQDYLKNYFSYKKDDELDLTQSNSSNTIENKVEIEIEDEEIPF